MVKYPCQMWSLEVVLESTEKKTEMLNSKMSLGQAVVTHACNPSTWDVVPGILEAHYHLQLHSKFKASQDYVSETL